MNTPNAYPALASPEITATTALRETRDPRNARDDREWTPQYKSVVRRSLVVLGARIQPKWLDRTVNVVQVRFVGGLAQVLGDLGEQAKAKKSKTLPTVRLKASLAFMLDGIIQIDRYLGLRQDRPRAAIELYTVDSEGGEHEQLIEHVRSCLKVWNNDVVQVWAKANGLSEVAERLGRAITSDCIEVTSVPQPLVQRTNGSRLGRPAYHLIARRLAEELVGASLFEGMSPVDLVVDPSDTSASAELLTQPVRMEGSRNMFSMAARLSVFTMPSSSDLFVKITPIKRVWSAELPGRKPNAPLNVSCTVMAPGKPFLTVRATQAKGRDTHTLDQGEALKSPWHFGDEYEEFLRRSKGLLPATLQEAVANLSPDPKKEGWWVGFPRLTTLFDRIGGRTVFERDEYNLHETVVQMLPWALDPKLEFRRVKAVAQKAAADATHTALKPSDIGHPEETLESGRAGQALLEDDLSDDERPASDGADTERAREVRLAVGQSSNVQALRALHGNRVVHLFIFGGDQREQDIIKACTLVLFGEAVQIHSETLPLHTHGLKSDLEKADAKSLERFEARVARWEAAFKQLPEDGGARYVLICADRLIGRRIEDSVNYYAAIHAACRAANANVHYVLPIQPKRGKDDISHFVHRVQSAMLDVFLAHAGVVLGVDDLVKQTIGSAKAGALAAELPKYVVGVQVVRSRARRRSAEDDVSFILYTRLSLRTGLVEVKIACRLGAKDTTTEWMDLAKGLRWLGGQRTIVSNEVWIREAFQTQTRSMLAKLKSEDERAIVLIDWMRLGSLWPQLRDDNLCEIASGSIFLGSADLSIACPGMTFVRLRSSRDTSMSIRRVTTKLYEGWATGAQGLEATGEVYTERYMGPAHEIVEVLSPDSKGRDKAGRWSNRHYLQVMRYRRTVQLQRGYSCYRSSERMKEIDAGDAADAPSTKRFKIVKFDPHHEDAALPATTEVTIVSGPADLDADQIVRLVMGLRLRYAHYPDWTALPAPLFFILKVDDYVIPYAELMGKQEPGLEAAHEAEAITQTDVEEETSNDLTLNNSSEGPEVPGELPVNRDPYFDDVSRAIVQQLPQLQLFDDAGQVAGSPKTMHAADNNETDESVAADKPSITTEVNADSEQGARPHAGDRGLTLPASGEAADHRSALSSSLASDSEKAEEEAERALRRPNNEILAKAWELIQQAPALYEQRDLNTKRAYEDMLRGQMRVSVELPWFITVETIVPADAWPDHKAISRFWRVQGDRGWRQPNKQAPTTSDFKNWVMQRLRVPQSSWSMNGTQVFKGGIRVFHLVYTRYDELLAERAAKGLEPPKLPGYSVFNSEELARWMRERNDDEGLGWLIAMAAHWPDSVHVERVFEILDGMELGPRTMCALEYLIDSCEVAKDIAQMPLAKRRSLQPISRKRDGRWEEVDRQLRQVLIMESSPLGRAQTTDIKSTQPLVSHTKTAIAAAVSVAASESDSVTEAPARSTNQQGNADPVTQEDISTMLMQNSPMSAIASADIKAPEKSSITVEINDDLLGERTQEAIAAVRGIAPLVLRLSPGADGFEQTLQAIRKHLDKLDELNSFVVAERSRRAQQLQEQQARLQIAQAAMAARMQLLETFFEDLRQSCASVPEDLVHEALEVQGDATSWKAYALSLDEAAHAAWMQQLSTYLAVIHEELACMQSTQVALDAVDAGTDQRLASVTGLARRQLKAKLQSDLVEIATAANHRMVAALANIAGLNPDQVTSPTAKSPAQAQSQAETHQNQQVTLTPADAPGEEAATSGELKVPVAVHEPAEGGDASSQVTATKSAETAQTAPGSTIAPSSITGVEVKIASPTLNDTDADLENVEPIDECELDEDLDSSNLVIEVDTQFDVAKLDKLIEPLQIASTDRLWRLTRVGVEALCAVQSHPTVQLHASAWNSMLDALMSLNVPGREQRLDALLMGWLDSEADGAVGDGQVLGFAMDVGVLGAGLLPILFEGHEAKVRWAVLSRVANRLQEHKPLYELCQLLQSLDSSSFTITRENLSAARVGPRKALEAEIMRQRDRAQNWSNDQVLFRNWPNPEYWDMHTAMFDDRHGMHFAKAMQLVVRGAEDPLRKMFPELRKYVEKMPGTLADLRKRTGRKRSLEGPHAEKLAHNMIASVKFIEDYLSLNERLSSVSASDTPRPLREFLDQLYAKTQAARDYLEQIQHDLHMPTPSGESVKSQGFAIDEGRSSPKGEELMLRLHATLARQIMQATLALMDEQVPIPEIAQEDQILLMDATISSNIEPVWSVQLEDNTTAATLRDPLAILREVASVQQQLAAARQSKPQQNIEDLLYHAADTHRQNGEILAARAIEQRMRNASQQVLSQMQSHNETAHRKQKAALSEELSDARQRVTNALAVGPMTQAEASRMLKVIETLDRANRENRIGAISSTPTAFEDYPQARALLRHHISEPLQQRIHESLRALKEDIAIFRERLDKMGLEESDRNRKIEQLERIMAGLKEVTPTNIRVARHSFSLLEQNELPLIRFSATNPAQAFETFQRELAQFTTNRSPLESLRDALRGVDDSRHWPKGKKPAWAAYLSEQQSQEAADFLDAWLQLTEARTINEVHAPLARFFMAAGTVEAPTAMSEPGNNGRTAFHLAPKTFVGSARLQNFWVPPILGSAARDLRGVVLRHRPQPELVAQVIDELPITTPNFVLGRTRLSLTRRSAISRDHPVIIVDDDLVAYMAVHPEQRLAKMMEVGLLTFHDNPYDDYGGPVPTEMFFGRRSELNRLAGNKSAMVLYGGRRLGKSSLLDRIQMESRQNLAKVGNEIRGEVAIYIPLESRIDSAVFGDDHKLFAWMGIYRGMVANSFIKPAKVDPKTADGIYQHIRSEIMAGAALTNACYLLIDEADEVMGRDIESSGAFASSLRALCDDVRDVCTIRYVIAGLHNLTRLHTEGNTALAKADAIALQPFSSGQDILMGVDLITKPLAALGFVFPRGSEELPMRILAMCNFYPAFVQLYCKNLIQDLYNKRGTKSPTTSIEASDLDKVERNKDFIGVMQEKFRYNLDLDKRYKGIALVLADTYYHGSGGVEQGLTANDLRSICDEYFPNYFSKTGEGAFPALLEEMEKLTVIDRKGGRYQLRTPHIATMMGSKEDVEHKIEELRRETAPSKRIPGETRPLLSRVNGNDSLLFPMSSGWVRQLLHEEERNLVVLVGNHLSGIVELENVKQPCKLGHDALFETKFFANIDSAKPFVNAMRRSNTDGDRPNRIVAVSSRAWNLSQMGDYASFASSMSRPLLSPDQRQRATNVRLMLLANPQQAWELAQMVQKGVQADVLGAARPVSPNWRVQAVPAWNDDAVYYRLKQLENQALPDQPDVCAEVLETTMGFGSELAKLLRSSTTREGVKEAKDEIRRRVAPTRTGFYAAIGWPSSIDAKLTKLTEDLLIMLDGEKRSDEDLMSWTQELGVHPAIVTYVRWMGLLQEGDGGTWRVPALYKALIAPTSGD